MRYSYRHSESPTCHLGVVAASENLRHLPPSENGGPGVLRVFEQPGAETLLGRRGTVSHYSGQKSGHRFHNRHRRNLTTAEHKITD